MIKSLPFKLLSATLVALACIAILSISLINKTKYLAELNDKIIAEQITMVVNGPVSLKLFPWPHINLNNVSLSYQEGTFIEAAQMDFYLKLFKRDTADVRLINAELKHDMLHKFSRERGQSYANFSVKLVDSIIVQNNAKFEKINGIIDFNPQDRVMVDIKGLFAGKNLGFYLLISELGKQNKPQEIKGSYNLTGATLEFKGTGQNILTDPKVAGSIKLSLSPDKMFGAKNNKNIVFNSNFNFDKELVLDNINVNSPHIKGFEGKISFKEKASVDAEKTSNTVSDIFFDFHIQDINLDEIFGQINIVEDLEKLLRYTLHNFSKTFYLDNCNITFKVDNSVIQQEQFKDIAFIAHGKSGQINIDKLEFSLPYTNSFVSLAGAISHNHIRPKFYGNIAISSQNVKQLLTWLGYAKFAEVLVSNQEDSKLLAKSNLSIIPHRIIFSDIKAILGNYVISGRSYIKNNDDESFRIHSSLKVNEISLDKYKVGDKLQDLLINLAIADLDKSGNYFFTLTDNFRWLRTIKGFYNIDLSVGSLTLNNYSYNNSSVNCQISPGVFNIKDFALNSEYAKLKGHMNLTIPEVKPQLNAEVNASMFDKKFFEVAIPPYETTINKAYAQMNQIKQEAGKGAKKENKSSKKEEKSESPPTPNAVNALELKNAIVAMQDNPQPSLNLLGLHNTEGTITINADKLVWGQYNLQNLHTHFSINNGLLHMTDFNASLNDGRVSMNGSMSLLAPIPALKISFNLANIDPGYITSLVLDEKELLEGYFSIAGQLETSGITYSNWLKNLSGRVTFIGKKIGYKGFDILGAVKTSALPNDVAYEQKLALLQKSENAGVSYFDNLNGEINILGGVATISNVTMDNIRVSGAFAALYDLNTKIINARAKFSFYPPNHSVFITIPLTSTGNFKNRATAFDNSEMEKFFAQGLSATVTSEQAAELLKSRKIK